MNTSIVTAEAKARLAEAVKNYVPPAPEKYRALNEVKESIIALKERKASYATIRAMLHENAGIEVSHQTVARYCRERLDTARTKKPRHPKATKVEAPAATQEEQSPERSLFERTRQRGPRNAFAKNSGANGAGVASRGDQ